MDGAYLSGKLERAIAFKGLHNSPVEAGIPFSYHIFSQLVEAIFDY